MPPPPTAPAPYPPSPLLPAPPPPPRQPRRVAFLLAAGPRIGLSVATSFLNAGYTVIVGSRNPATNPATPALHALGIRSVSCDVTSSSSIMIAFEKVRDDSGLGVWGVPGVVVYNAAALTFAGGGPGREAGEKGDGDYDRDGLGIFGMDIGEYENDLNANLIGGYVAMREAVKGWRDLEGAEIAAAGAETDARRDAAERVPKVFIATGNVLPWQPVPEAMTLGSGKAALAHLVRCGSMSEEYRRRGWRFHFVSQVTKEGGTVEYGDVDGDAHGREYMRIVEEGEKRWDVRFVA